MANSFENPVFEGYITDMDRAINDLKKNAFIPHFANITKAKEAARIIKLRAQDVIDWLEAESSER